MKITALIMAGGKGERFWPRSRTKKPKQFIDISGCGKTMIQLTVERILPLVDMNDIFIATNWAYKEIVREQLPNIPEENILCEPVGRNTAPCIGLGATYMLSKGEDVVMMVLASDHLMKYEDIYINVMKEAVEIAHHGDNIVTIGITPNCPETGYGYIKKKDGEEGIGKAGKVEKFVEKPDLETAKKYLEEGGYYWNSGMFVWKASTVMNSIKKYMPDIYYHLEKIGQHIGKEDEKQVLNDEFTSMRSESVDYGIMEKAEDIYVLPGNFGWDDVGSWLAIERIKGTDELKNTISGNVISIDTKNSIIEANDKLIATVGIDGIVVVDTEDALLIGSKEKMTDIKGLLKLIKESNKSIVL